MATKNRNLEKITDEDVLQISERFLMGWHNLEHDYGFRIKSLNNKRAKLGLEPLDKNVSMDYRIQYIKDRYSDKEIYDEIAAYLCNARIADERWNGIELFGCRFGQDYARAFRRLLGSATYRKLSEEMRVKKSEETQYEKYGGVGLGGFATKEKAVNTNLVKYGAPNPMQSKDVQDKLTQTNTSKFGGMSPFNSLEIRQKAADSRNAKVYEQCDQFAKDGIFENMTCFKSDGEKIVFCELVNKFGRGDVFYQYGIHPSDKRYPFNCDFYVKSLDLFIELNGHYSHHTHWFDPNNADDLLRQKNISVYGKKRSKASLKIWCGTDVQKRETAKKNGLNYLVFWDGTSTKRNNVSVPNLRDFYLWLNDYCCNTVAFLKDHPENTY